jgi:hypothetical protein
VRSPLDGAAPHCGHQTSRCLWRAAKASVCRVLRANFSHTGAPQQASCIARAPHLFDVRSCSRKRGLMQAGVVSRILYAWGCLLCVCSVLDFTPLRHQV